MKRRKFIRILLGGAAGTALGGVCTAAAAKLIGTTRISIAVPNLPKAFHGKTIALLSDIHHSVVVPRSYIDHVVKVTNALSPDMVVLGGDYVTCESRYQWLHGEKYLGSCFESLKKLESKMGCFAVTGNHDTHAGVENVHKAMEGAGIHNIDNDGVWLTEQGQRMRLCGVSDLRTQTPDVPKAVADATKEDAVVLVSHNPDVAEKAISDERVGLQLSGHTHGGQIVLPFLGAPAVPFCSDYGQKYREGLVQGAKYKVFVTRGVGTLLPAFRLNCPPEVALITLTSPGA